jgi:hypothetical protein
MIYQLASLRACHFASKWLGNSVVRTKLAPLLWRPNLHRPSAGTTKYYLHFEALRTPIAVH